MNIFERIKELGIEYDNHCSDLYIPKTYETKKLVNEYEFKNNVKTFKDNITGNIWYDIPFAYTPYYEERRGK